ncbi:MAG: BMP family ABC transporter substrate-binding protein [Gaiellaceae bacterium MAG52_C11]|nr:BMP family ABC transporter substrate-binding protein [Candidatus Gaiellasilicea maunaloa]
MRFRSVLAALVMGVVLLAGCGSDDENAARDTTPATTEATETGTDTGASAGPAIKVGLVTDIGGLDDRSFNFLANQGLDRAQEQLGAEGRVLVSRANSDYVPNLSTLAQQDYDLIVGVGFLMAESVETVAEQFPDTNFAIIDFSQAAMESKPANVRGLLFKEQEAGYLVGYLSGLVVADSAGANQTISSVGGQKIPPVDRYIAGYQAGAKAANPRVQTLNGYSQDFVDQAKCKEIALNQIARGSSVVFQVAGQCGLGALNAAKEQNASGIGVDADQGYLGEHVVTSALKKVDVAVFQTVQAVQDGSFAGGEDSVFDVASGGVGLGEIAASVPPDVVAKVKQVQEQIAAGEIVDIPETVGGG